MKSLPERSTRGVRQRNLQGAAMEADMQFWNQDYFKELSEDDDFSDSHGSEPLSDSEDSDIDLPEDEPEQPLVIERPEKKEKVKRTVYLDPAFKKRKAKKKAEPPKEGEENAQQPPPPPKPKAPAPPLEVKLRASTQYKSMVSATQRQFEEEMEEASSRPRKKAVVRRMTQSQMLRQCISTEVENTLSLREILKEEEKKKTVAKKKVITGNRLCILSDRKHPYYHLYSTPILCPSWSVPLKPSKTSCVFGDGPGRYKDPHTGDVYCSLKCGRRLKEERQKECLLTLHLPQETKSVQPTQPTLPPASDPSSQPVQLQSPSQSILSQLQPAQAHEQSQTQQQVQQQVQQQPVQPPQPPQPIQPSQPSSPQPSNPVKPQTPLTAKAAASTAPQKPMIVSTTTPQGQVVQYQLNVAKTIYINSQGVTVPVNQNQVYYLQTSLPNGEKSVQPHLMTGSSRMNDGNVYYCMVPMVPLSSNTTSA